MTNLINLQSEKLNYDPSNLLDTLIDCLSLSNDAALAKTLQVAAPVISKIRNLHQPVGATLLINMHEESGISIADLRALMGDRRAKFSTHKHVNKQY